MINGLWSIVSSSSQTRCPSSQTKDFHPFYFVNLFVVCIFVPVMALLDLEKIIIKRTILGIRCTVCGGNLVLAKKKSSAGRFIKLISFGTINPKNYECENCKKRHLLL